MTGTERAPGVGSLCVASLCEPEQAEPVVGQLLLFAIRQPGAPLVPGDALEVGEDDARHPFGVDGHAVAQRDGAMPGEGAGVQDAAQFVDEVCIELGSHGPTRTFCSEFLESSAM